MTREREGRLTFDFSAADTVERLDAQGRRIPSGMSLVDFVVEEPGRTLLVEVKDPERASPEHRQRELERFIEEMRGDALISDTLVPKARDSYTFLHLMKRDGKDFIFVVLLGVGTNDPALLGNFKNRLLARLRQEADRPWERRYIRDCVVVTPEQWAEFFPSYPISFTS